MINSQENNIHIGSIGGRVKSLRDSAGLNQTDFAEKLGVKQAFISKVEKNNASLTIDHIILLKNIFDVDMNWLLTGEGKEPEKTALPPRTAALVNNFEALAEDDKKAIERLAFTVAQSQKITKKAG